MAAKSWNTKKFNGKTYHKYGTEPTKQGAEHAVKVIRASGFSARYSKFVIAKRHGGGHFFIIWTLIKR